MNGGLPMGQESPRTVSLCLYLNLLSKVLVSRDEETKVQDGGQLAQANLTPPSLFSGPFLEASAMRHTSSDLREGKLSYEDRHSGRLPTSPLFLPESVKWA